MVIRGYCMVAGIKIQSRSGLLQDKGLKEPVAHTSGLMLPFKVSDCSRSVSLMQN